MATFMLPDGAKLAYDVLGSEHLGKALPIVLIGGMSSRRIDWERLSSSLQQERPVLLFDHRGIGDSSLTPAGNEIMTMEMLARDLVHLLKHLGWQELAICGFSLGGVVAQQVLFLPYHPTNPTPLPFRLTHLLLTGTMISVLKDLKRYGLKVNTSVPNTDKPLTPEQKKELVRPTLESTFDPEWVKDPANRERFSWWLERMILKRWVIPVCDRTDGIQSRPIIAGDRPIRTIIMQGRAIMKFNFDGLYDKVPKDTKILVIHGELDLVLPFSGALEIMQKLPQAKFVNIGPHPGQVPHLQFGHHWFEYFDIKVWHDVVTRFLLDSGGRRALL
ncbi:hypothetical protein AX16_008828 [Volvariella volvacea WC 439]|nr:hypothetical protein AX16_008828 [Volvariella volvacea WC 439]